MGTFISENILSEGGITGNTISGNTLIITNSIDSVGRTLNDSSNNPSVDWNNFRLYGTTANVYWDNGQLKDAGPQLSVDWPNRTLNDTNEDIILDWQNKIMSGMTSIKSSTISATTYQNLPLDIRVTGGTYSSGTATFTNNTGGTFTVTGFSTGGGGSFTGGTVTGPTDFTGGLSANTIYVTDLTANTINTPTLTVKNNIDSSIRTAYDSTLFTSLNWENRTLYDSASLDSVSWRTRYLVDPNGYASVDWENRVLNDSAGTPVIDWSNKTIDGMSVISATTISGGTLYGDGSNLTGIGGGTFITGNTVSVQARRTTLYSLTLSFTNITFDVTDVETDPTVISHNGTNTDRIYIYESGLYELHYHCDIGHGTTANDFETRLYLNDLSAINGSSLSGKSSSTDRITVASNTIFSATSGDYITLQAKYPAASGGLVGNATLSVKQLKGIKGDTGSQGAQGPIGIGLFTGGTITGDTNFTGGLSANTLNFVTTPTNNNTNTQLLARNSTTGNVEYRDASSISGGGGVNSGIVYAFSNNYQLI